jgi:hypothetical protein
MSLVVAAIAVVATSPALAATEGSSTPISLSCDGHGAFLIPNLDKDEDGQFKSAKRGEAQGRVRLRISEDAIQLRLPATMPGGDAWKTAEGVTITPERFSGKVRLGLISSIHFVVDRHTGDIDVTGSVQFGGSCEKAPDEGAPAKF